MNTKPYISRLVIFSLLLLLIQKVIASSPNCENIGFEMGDFTNWTGYTWIYQTYPSFNVTPKVEGIVSGRQTIMTDPYALDVNTGNQLLTIPRGYKYSAKLGNTNKGGQHQTLQYTLHVDPLNSLLIVKFAVVFLNPTRGHTKEEEPRFTITFFDSKGDTIPGCANYDVYSGDATIDGFQEYNPYGNDSPVVWRDWTTVGLNMQAYIGQDITVEFMSADCTRTGHYGYAYVLAECAPMRITVDYCNTDASANLVAPDGFLSYVWKKDNVEVGTEQVLIIDNPNEGDIYQCELTSETKCTITLEATLEKYNPKAVFTSNFDCGTNTVAFQNQSTITNGSIEYEWDFGDGITSDEKNPTHTYNTFGEKTVKLTIKNPPSTCTDTMSQVIYTFERQKVRIEGNPNYCLGEKTILYGKDAYSYQWSTGQTSDSIEVGTSGTYWVIGFSKDGSCSSAPIYYDVSSFPDWTLDIQGDSYFCDGESVILKASGAQTYVWNTGETTNQITITDGGTYTVTGTNENGCVKQTSFDITKIDLPKVNFNLSKKEINLGNNTVTASVSPEQNVTYLWDFGDGTQLTGSSATHQYYIDYAQWHFPIKLTATNNYGCTNDSTQIIDVIFFTPNVFTPNGDGVNDTFMPDVKLEVYNRNGVLMYKGENGWNGNYKGQKADNDTYFYYLIYKNGDGEEKSMKGYVILKR